VAGLPPDPVVYEESRRVTAVRGSLGDELGRKVVVELG
jgi:hypothetical protein